MRATLFPIVCAVFLSACAASKPETVIVTRIEALAPPLALLHVRERPMVPPEPVTKADAEVYLIMLYEWGRGLEAQITAIAGWVVEAKRIRASER